MKPIYTPNLKAANIEEKYSFAPYNLSTMRARRSIEKLKGCAYIHDIAVILAGLDGETLTETDGTPYEYLAYCASQAHDTFLRRRHHRHLIRDGWSKPTGSEPVGAKYIAWINGKEIEGRIDDDNHGRRYFMPQRHRRCGYLLNQPIYLKPTQRNQTQQRRH